MKLVVITVAILILGDFVRSAWRIRKVYKSFYDDHAKKPDRSKATFGTGKPFHLAVIGDSTFDVHAASKVPYGPAQVFIDTMSKNKEVYVHFYASAGAKANEVINQQLPMVRELPHVDLLLVYMGANDIVTGHWPGRVGAGYKKLFAFTESRKIPVIASELANYWHFSLFPLVYRCWLYIAIHLANAGIRAQANKVSNVAVASVKLMHKSIHKKRKNQPYLLDGFHPNDATSRRWGEVMLEEAKHDPKTKQLFTDIMS